MSSTLVSDGDLSAAAAGWAGADTRAVASALGRVAVIAARDADRVDRDGCFPQAAMDALRAEGLMAVLIPADLGGGGGSLEQVANVCYGLGRVCASTAMIFAMHQIKAACLIRHAAGEPWQADFLRRAAEGQWLLASSTTEGKGGGDVRSSAAPATVVDGELRLERDATVMSYGAQADAVVTTARRSADAPASDQVLVVFERADYVLTPTQSWETLGMRGTCSAGFAMSARGVPEQVVTQPYARIHTETMTPVAHLLWSSVWSGIAASALARAQRYTRKVARGGQLPPGAPHLTRAFGSFRALQSLLACALAEYVSIQNSPEAVGRLDFQTRITLLKVETSELAVETVLSAMRACGLSGYRTDGEASLGRHLRDVLSAPIMINNDRILSSLGGSALMSDIPSALFA